MIACMETLASRIREARERAGLSMSDLAKRVGVSKQAVWGWETGSTKGPRPEHLLALRDILSVSIDWLVFGNGHPAPEKRSLSDHQQAVIDLYDALPETEKKAFFRTLQDKKQYIDSIIDDLASRGKLKQQ